MKSMQAGFSLIEVLVALVMVSITLPALISLQSMLSKIVYNDTMQWHAEQEALSMFAEVAKKEALEINKPFERDHEGFKTVYLLLKPEDKTPIGEIKDIFMEKVTVSWTRLFRTETATYMRLVYRPEAAMDSTALTTSGGGRAQPEENKTPVAGVTT